MKSRAAKMITALVLVALTLVSVVLPASAEVYSPYIYSTSAATAGTYKTEKPRVHDTSPQRHLPQFTAAMSAFGSTVEM